MEDNERFVRLTLNGDPFIEPLPATAKTQGPSYLHLIMGPTGAGKSSLIETLAGKSQALSISKDQLAGYTQNVAVYKLINVLHLNYPLYLIDTPGFLDNKISEIEIMNMITSWMRTNRSHYVDRIFYLIPINDTRLAGTKRRTIEMLKEFIESSGDVGSVVFVTTMWDKLYNERAEQRAEANFVQLRDDILKAFLDRGAKITRFMNTQKSALRVLDSGIFTNDSFGPRGPKQVPRLYQLLLERISNTIKEQQALKSDLYQEETQTNVELKDILERQLSANQHTLRKFVKQLEEFGEPPTGFEADHERILVEIGATNNVGAGEQMVTFDSRVGESS